MADIEITPRGFERESDKLTEAQLDAPVDDEVVEEPSSESVPEEAVESEPEAEEESPDESKAEEIAESEPEEEEEERVPKSRFLTMHQRAVEAEKLLRQLEADRANQPEKQEAVFADDESIRKHYVELFGESELTDKLYRAELARLTSIEDKAAERAFERLSQQQQQAERQIEERVESFDFAFEELTAQSGKEFNDDEQVAILDIVEKYSPKDQSGKLIGEYLMPLDQAYEIYQVQNAPKVAAKKTARNKAAAVIGARSDGSVSQDTDSDWQPGQERRWWNKV